MTTPAGALRLRDELLAGPGLYPQRLDLERQLMALVQLTQDDYRRASFLDDRILGPDTQGKWVQIESVEMALAGVEPQRPLHFIFHAGHVGSTLVSRLLEEAGGVLALREPLPLRTLAEVQDTLGGAQQLATPAQFDALVRQQIILWSRGYADTRAAIVKATSTAARLAPRLLTAAPSARAIYLTLDLDSYLAALLAGENSIADLKGHAEERVLRLATYGLSGRMSPLDTWSPGELAALGWITEMLTMERLRAQFGARVLTMDFHLVLSHLGPALREMCKHLELSAPEEYFTSAEQSPVLQRYAKSPDAAYSPQARAEILAQSRKQHAEEIATGRRFVGGVATVWREVAALLA